MINMHPGEYILGFIEEGGIDKESLAIELELTIEQLESLLNKEISITEEIAIKLSKGSIGRSCKSWIRMQERYDESLQ